MSDTSWVGVVLLLLLGWTSLAIVRQTRLLSTAMLTGIFSLLGAGWMLYLDAPDVAFTEAAVGAGISTILILATLSVTAREEKNVKESGVGFLVVLVTGAVLVSATVDMPRYGDPKAPATDNEITRRYLHSASPQPEGHWSVGHKPPGIDAYAVGIPNTVTTVLASFRGFDTMGETAVIFTAGLGVLVILRGARRRRYESDEEIDLKPRDDSEGSA